MNDFLDVMTEYFRGEKMLAWAFVAIGVVLLGFAIFVFRSHTGGFRLGLAIPLAIVGVLATAAGPFFAKRNDALARDIAARYSDDPAELARAETLRMEKVNANWPRLKIVWALIALCSIGLLIFVKQDWASGLGLALLLIATLFFAVDVLGERRAVVYTDALAQIG